MEENKDNVVFSNLNISKLKTNVGSKDIIGGIGFEFQDKIDQYAILDFNIEAEKQYRIEFDVDAEKQYWLNYQIVIINKISLPWYNNSELTFTYTQSGHYIIDIPQKSYDRKIVLIGNRTASDTGYVNFTNFVIYEMNWGD